MPDNTGNYVSKAQLLPEIVNAEKGSSKALTLSNQSGSTFEYSGVSGADLPVIGDWVAQGSAASTVTNVQTGPARITLADPTGFANGAATLFKLSPAKTASELDGLIALAMAFVDRSTRWWFNSRSFTLKVEGNNSSTLLLGVPVLEITSAVVNEEVTLSSSQIDEYLIVPKSRTYPDDRRNPLIKFRRDVRNVFLDIRRGDVFRRGRTQSFTGRYGFLEEDGSTPLLIQRATLKYAVLKMLDSPGAGAADTDANSDTGPLKREKTDIHEKEFYDPAKSESSSSKSKSAPLLSGDQEIDDILRLYRSPILIAGSFADEGVEAPRFQGGVP